MAARTSLQSLSRQSISCIATPLRRPCSAYLSASQDPASRPCRAHAIRNFSAHRSLLAKRYTEDHEWIEIDGDGKSGTIGVSAYAAKALGEVVYVELPQPDTEISVGDTIAAVESVKSASDIMTPVAGTITKANGVLEETPGLINKSPEDEGWIAKVTIKDAAEVEKLMDEAAYGEFVGNQAE